MFLNPQTPFEASFKQALEPQNEGVIPSLLQIPTYLALGQGLLHMNSAK